MAWKRMDGGVGGDSADDDYADDNDDNTQEAPGGVVWVEGYLHPLLFGNVCKIAWQLIS